MVKTDISAEVADREKKEKDKNDLIKKLKKQDLSLVELNELLRGVL